MSQKGKELCTNVINIIVKAYRDNKNTSKLERTLGTPKFAKRDIVEKNEETGHVENRKGRGRRRMFSDRDKNKLSHVVEENRQRTYENITGFVNEGNNKTFCTQTIKRNIQELRYKRSVA